MTQEELSDKALCLWKDLHLSNGTTFQDVKNEKHPLYKCVKCEGYKPNVCDNYHAYKPNEVKKDVKKTIAKKM